jgi:hypothetical protein
VPATPEETRIDRESDSADSLGVQITGGHRRSFSTDSAAEEVAVFAFPPITRVTAQAKIGRGTSKIIQKRARRLMSTVCRA